MKAKIFEVVLRKLPSGKSPASALEEQLNQFLGQHLDLRLVATHMSTLVSPAEPNAMPSSEDSSIIISAHCSIPTRDERDMQPITKIRETKKSYGRSDA